MPTFSCILQCVRGEAVAELAHGRITPDIFKAIIEWCKILGIKKVWRDKVRANKPIRRILVWEDGR